MSHNRQPYRSHRRRKKSNAGKVGLAGALTGVVGIAAVAAAIVVLRPDGSDSGADPTRPASAGQNDAGDQGPSVAKPKTGPPVNFMTPEGYGYSLAAVKTGTDAKPLGATKAPPSGTTYAYADYVLTNSQRRPVLMDYPADLFLPKKQVPEATRERCMPQPGIPDDMCTLPNHSQITARIDGARPPADENGDAMIPAGASYVVRIATDLPVDDSLSADDLRLYVWNARFTSDRKGIQLTLP